MTAEPHLARLSSRAVIRIGGADWRDFLQGLLTQDVDTLKPGELRFGALLNPQGRLLYDLFIVGTEDGCLLDVAADKRQGLIQRLSMYRLRSKVTIEAADAVVEALWGLESAPGGWLRDPRIPELGWRGYGEPALSHDDTGGPRLLPIEIAIDKKGAITINGEVAQGDWEEALKAATERRPASPREQMSDEMLYEFHRLRLGAPGPEDWGYERTYPIEANFDLLNGIDFKKGCFVGQEITSRMKRRGQIKNRMLPLEILGPPPRFEAEVLAGERRTGEILSGAGDRAIALMRLDRIEGVELEAQGAPVRVVWPDWFPRPEAR